MEGLRGIRGERGGGGDRGGLGKGEGATRDLGGGSLFRAETRGDERRSEGEEAFHATVGKGLRIRRDSRQGGKVGGVLGSRGGSD